MNHYSDALNDIKSINATVAALADRIMRETHKAEASRRLSLEGARLQYVHTCQVLEDTAKDLGMERETTDAVRILREAADQDDAEQVTEDR